MTNKDLIKQYVDTGLAIPKYQISKLPNWAKSTYVRKRLIATKNKGLSLYEFKLLNDVYKDKYLRGLKSDNLVSLLNNSKIQSEQDSLIDFILTNESFGDYNIFSILLQYYSDLDKLIGVILKKYLNHVEGHTLSEMIVGSSNPDYVIDEILNNEHSVSILKPKSMDYMLQKSSDSIGVIKKFLNLRKDLNDTEVSAFLIQGMGKVYDESFVTINFLNYFKDTITNESLHRLILRAKDTSKMIKIMNKIFGEERINGVI